MATKKKMLQATAGNAGGGLDITDVFSTYLYDGTGSTQTITNGIDLDGEGGAILTKRRDSATGSGPWFNDTERGITKYISTSDTGTGGDSTASISAATSTGYTLGGSFSGWNNSAGEYASWTFRKAPKFFDCITYSGNGTAGRTISHNLGSAPGMIVVKNLTTGGSGFSDWRVWHRSESGKTATLNTTSAFSTTDAASKFGNGSSVVQPTSTEFTVAADYDVNRSGESYVAYLFAHNDGDGEFGSSGDQDIIKCGSYTGNETSVDLGFEPQFIIVKRVDSAENWMMFDTMRGWVADGNSLGWLMPNKTNSESTLTNGNFGLTSTGFKMSSGYSPLNNGSGSSSYIYIAIRRGPLAPPESATEVFNIHNQSGSYLSPINVGFTTDLSIMSARNGQSLNATVGDRLRGSKFLSTSQTNADDSGINWQWDLQNKFQSTWTPDTISWMWKRAPGYFDVVAYTGAASAQTLTHNLGVVPEMIWIKKRSEVSYYGFVVYHGTTGNMYLSNNFSSGYGGSNAVNHSTISDTTFQLANGNIDVNDIGETHIAYLFASLPGISKVGSYTGTGNSGGDINVDCGFTSGARFVMIKRTDASGSWWVADTERGIVSGNEPLLALDSTSAEITGFNMVKPYSSGFIVNGSGGGDNSWNDSGGSYIFYAIA